MTVGELITQLQGFKEDTPVYTIDSEFGYSDPKPVWDPIDRELTL